MPADPLLTTLLRDVSRSFYLTLRVLPCAVRPQIGLAYLLARTTDTIADTRLVPADDRLATLARLRARILSQSTAPLDLARFLPAGPGTASGGASPAERALLTRVEEALAVLNRFETTDRHRIQEVLDIIISGQELDLQRFEFPGARETPSPSATPAGSPRPRLRALQTDAELDDYTYRVAGCVGEFWTRICRAHVFPLAAIDDTRMLADGIRFGKGLQWVNILRDLPRDLRNGRCYLPAERMTQLGLQPEDLLQPANENRVRPLYDSCLDRARGHLEAGWRYTHTVPWGCVRVRLACAWPILIGLRTLARLRTGRFLDPDRRLKVSRAEVRSLVLQSLWRYPFPRAWNRLASG